MHTNSFIATVLSKNLTDFSTQKYCRVEFSFEFYDKLVNKMADYGNHGGGILYARVENFITQSFKT